MELLVPKLFGALLLCLMSIPVVVPTFLASALLNPAAAMNSIQAALSNPPVMAGLLQATALGTLLLFVFRIRNNWARYFIGFLLTFATTFNTMQGAGYELVSSCLRHDLDLLIIVGTAFVSAVFLGGPTQLIIASVGWFFRHIPHGQRSEY